MEIVRKVIDAELLKGLIELPESVKGKKVQIIVLPVSEKETEFTKSRFSMLYSYPIEVEEIIFPSKGELHERTGIH